MARRRYSARLKEKRDRARAKEYWPRVWESDGFEVDHLQIRPLPPCGMQVFRCEPDEYPDLLYLYAKLGLHKYNMLQGTNLQLHHIEKYNKFFRCMPSEYYITLVAQDPSFRGSLVTFQASVHENSANCFDVKCYVARPKSKENKCTILGDGTETEFLYHTAPKWPSHDVLAKKNRCYLVKESELKENDWIRLYMELAFLTTHRQTVNPKLPELEIVEVVVETRKVVKPHNAKLKGPRNALIYIQYKQHLGKGRFRKHRARIRRSVDLRSQRLNLVGENEELEDDDFLLD